MQFTFQKEKFNVTDFKTIYHDVNIPMVHSLVFTNDIMYIVEDNSYKNFTLIFSAITIYCIMNILIVEVY